MRGARSIVFALTLGLIATACGGAGTPAPTTAATAGAPTATVDPNAALAAFYGGKTAKWQVPDDVVFVDAIPLGATGKILKTRLREQLRDYKLPGC